MQVPDLEELLSFAGADNYPFQEFLASCNPNQQQAHTLESYLIKPIQRILKYPLLLQQLKASALNPSEEQNHLTEALAGMENVAEHINEMQRIHEEYGAIFDHLYRQYQRSTSQLHELNPGDLLYYGGVEWLNIANFLGKIKKGLELHAMCFIFRTAVVFLCKERLRSKRKQLLVISLGQITLDVPSILALFAGKYNQRQSGRGGNYSLSSSDSR